MPGLFSVAKGMGKAFGAGAKSAGKNVGKALGGQANPQVFSAANQAGKAMGGAAAKGVEMGGKAVDKFMGLGTKGKIAAGLGATTVIADPMATVGNVAGLAGGQISNLAGIGHDDASSQAGVPGLGSAGIDGNAIMNLAPVALGLGGLLTGHKGIAAVGGLWALQRTGMLDGITDQLGSMLSGAATPQLGEAMSAEAQAETTPGVTFTKSGPATEQDYQWCPDISSDVMPQGSPESDYGMSM